MPSNTSLDAYWNQPIGCVLAGLHSSPDGLSVADARQRLKQLGPNLLEPKHPMTALGLLLSQFRSPLVLILIFAAVVSAIVHEWVDATVILVIVLGGAVLSFAQEYRVTTAIEQPRARVTVKVTVTVLRDSQPRSIPAEEVVPGDVILLSAGSLIPADGSCWRRRIVSSTRLSSPASRFRSRRPPASWLRTPACQSVRTVSSWASRCAMAPPVR